MGFLSRLFSPKEPALMSGPSKPTIEIRNNYGHYDGSPLLLVASPDLESILGGDTPVIQKLSSGNRAYWQTAPLDERRMTALIGYLQHPDPGVRTAAMRFVASNDSSRVAQALFDRLISDPEPAVRSAAAQTIWSCEKKFNCKFATRKLKDTRDRAQVQDGLKLLVDQAPDAEARKAVQALFDSREDD